MENRQGFTLLELVMIIVLISIIAMFAVPRMTDVTTMKAGSFADKLRSDIRFGQNLAMTRNRRSRVYFNGTGTAPGAGYAVVTDSSALRDCSVFSAAPNPSLSGNLTVTLNAGTYAGITANSTTNCVEFDSLGRPYDCIANLGVCSSTSAGPAITVNPGGYAVAVTIQTGVVN